MTYMPSFRLRVVLESGFGRAVSQIGPMAGALRRGGFRFDFEQTHEATEVVFVVITASDRFVPSLDVLIGERRAVECSHEPSRPTIRHLDAV